MKAPLMCPKNSLSRTRGDSALQLTGMKAPLRVPAKCMDRAISSLPVPVSPRISTGLSVGAIFETRVRRATMGGLPPRSRDGWKDRRAASSRGPSSRRGRPCSCMRSISDATRRLPASSRSTIRRPGSPGEARVTMGITEADRERAPRPP